MVKRLVWTEKALLTKKEIFDYWNKKTQTKNTAGNRKLNLIE